MKIWEERKTTPLAVLRPHDGKPVNSVTFLTAPHRPEHIVLITAVCSSLNLDWKYISCTLQKSFVIEFTLNFSEQE